MKARGSGVALALAVLGVLLGGAGGYWWGERPRPVSSAYDAAPIPAASPSYPVVPPVVSPDPTDPPLAPGVPLQEQRIRAARGFPVTLPVPRGWVRSDANPGEWLFYPSWGQTEYRYFIRVRTVANTYQAVDRAVAARIDALRGADAVDDFRLESEQTDRFVASYVNDAHRRVAYEGFLDRNDSGVAYLYIAVIGREADRAGLADLFDRMMSGARL